MKEKAWARTLGPSALVAAGLLCGAPAASAEPGITVDLNKLEAVEGACRAYLVLENATESKFTGFTLDLYVFNAEGVIQKRLVVETAPLTPERTRIRPVDIREMTCEQVAKVVVNDVIDCVDASGELQDCVDRLALTNRTAATFSK